MTDKPDRYLCIIQEWKWQNTELKTLQRQRSYSDKCFNENRKWACNVHYTQSRMGCYYRPYTSITTSKSFQVIPRKDIQYGVISDNSLVRREQQDDDNDGDGNKTTAESYRMTQQTQFPYYFNYNIIRMAVLPRDHSTRGHNPFKFIRI